jgi:Rps23 Pro-64 3,4-dihydroxylase Tpa1-like proline 4-hydroxylase
MLTTTDRILKNKEVQFDSNPFPHLLMKDFLAPSIESELLNWFDLTDCWNIMKTDFYEQYEFSLFDVEFPNTLQLLIDNIWIDEIKKLFRAYFNVHTLELVDVTAHKHTDGQSIGIHNDYIGGDESHRLVIQINSNYSDSNGGYQMLFNSINADDIAKVIRPLSNSAMGFEISEQSYHAVSQIIDFNRFSLVYTFRSS